MRAREFTNRTANQLRTFLVRLKLRQKGYSQYMDTMVQARNQDQARKILRAQYDSRNVVIGNPRELRRP
jgi:hypothetical protein